MASSLHRHDSDADSVTVWFNAVRQGDEQAATNLWNRYFDRLVRIARRRLVKDAGYDEEDLAASVFKSFYAQLQDGEFPSLVDRDELWALLITIAMRKSNDRLRFHRAAKRQLPTGEQVDANQIPDNEPPPDLAAVMAEECRDLLDRLEDPVLEAVAMQKMEGATHAEVGKHLNCSARSVSRMLGLIRHIWTEPA